MSENTMETNGFCSKSVLRGTHFWTPRRANVAPENVRKSSPPGPSFFIQTFPVFYETGIIATEGDMEWTKLDRELYPFGEAE